MSEAWHLILLLIPLIAGAISIFFAFRLMKRFAIPFAGSFFYYLVFLYIFGTYSLAGSGIMQHLLGRLEIDLKVIHSARLYAIFLGIPFLALAKFMFLRTILDFFQKKPSTAFTVVYFFCLTAAFVLYGIYMVRLTRFDQGNFQRLMEIQHWTFLAFMCAVYLSSFLYILLSSSKLPDPPAEKYIRFYGASYMAFMMLTVIPLALTDVHPLFRQVFLLIFLSWHLIPLLFMNIYLNKYQSPENELLEDFEDKMLSFAAEHEISKRECDVVRLICRGLSNQEISEELFISLQTVKDHTHRIFVKTGVRNRVQLSNMLR